MKKTDNKRITDQETNPPGKDKEHAVDPRGLTREQDLGRNTYLSDEDEQGLQSNPYSDSFKDEDGNTKRRVPDTDKDKE